MRHLLKFIVLAFVFPAVLIIQGCSFFGSERSTASPSGGLQLPLSLQVVDEVNDGSRLHILGSVSAATDWDLKDVIVKLTGLNNGQEVGISYLPLANADTRKEHLIKAGEKFTFSISVPSPELTDYQIELLWGEDAKRNLALARAAQPGSVELRDIQVETIRQPCSGSDCEVTFRITGKIHNGTGKNITNLVLGVGYIRTSPAKLDLTRQIPQNEENIDIGRFLLAPGASREVRLNFDRPVLEKELVNQAGQLKPSIRIISFETG